MGVKAQFLERASAIGLSQNPDHSLRLQKAQCNIGNIFRPSRDRQQAMSAPLFHIAISGTKTAFFGRSPWDRCPRMGTGRPTCSSPK